MAFRNALPIWFTESEQTAYRYVANHLSRYSRMPTLQTLAQQGINLPVANEPAEFYAEQLQDRAVSTQIRTYHPALLQAMSRMDMRAAREAIRNMDQGAMAVAPGSGISSLQDQAQIVLQQYNLARRNHSLVGVTLGWEVLDLVTDGAQGGDIIVIAGRPNLGKTYLMLHMMRQAWLSGASIFVASMEMGGPQLSRRLLGMQAGINPGLIRSGQLSSFGHHTFLETIRSIPDMPPVHVMTGNFRKNVSDVNRAVQELSPDIVCVDAGYLLTPDKRKGQNRREVISDVIEELKQLAIDRNRPLITTVQFNRQVKRKQRGAPDLGDIAETDVIAQIASLVLGAQHGRAPFEASKRIISLLKNRDGETLSFECNFSLSPPDFNFTRLVTEEDDGTSEPAQDLSSMM